MVRDFFLLNISNFWFTSLHFTVHSMSSDLKHVDEARKELFCRQWKTIEKLTPTQDALLQHVKRVTYQAGIRWRQTVMCVGTTACTELV